MTRYEQLQEHLKDNQSTWLVTGVAGFIGSNLLEKLLILNQKVVGLDSFDTGYQHNVDQAIQDANHITGKDLSNNFKFINGDIKKLSDCKLACDGVDYVLHQAALGSVPRSIEDPISSNEANINGFVNMLVAARDAKIKRFVYAASSSSYGDNPSLPKVEHMAGNPLSPYAVTKLVNELYADVFARNYNFKTIGLRYFNIFDVTEPIGKIFNGLYNQPYLVVIPVLLMYALYRKNFSDIKHGFYLDGTISKKAEKASNIDLTWMNRFGSIAVFLKNDVRLILRNARPKQVLMMSFLFLFYGLIFYTQETYQKMPAFLAFASMFVTGGFLMTFGQLVPSWDSEYYKLLMSQNIPYKKYLESKWYLMVVAVGISFILSTPYLYFGWKIFGMITAGALFNIGLNSFITLFGGALNRVPIELNVKAKAFSNTNGFNPTQMLIALPKLGLPMLLFYIPYKLVNFEVGLIVLALSGVLGIVFRNFFFLKTIHLNYFSLFSVLTKV